jgi:hypothetical protein
METETMKTHRVRRKGAEHVTFVVSESDDCEYELARLPTGLFACACLAFAFNKDTPRTCKHITAFAASVAAAPPRAPAPRRPDAPPPATVTIGTETFTFRRAISFSKELR